MIIADTILGEKWEILKNKRENSAKMALAAAVFATFRKLCLRGTASSASNSAPNVSSKAYGVSIDVPKRGDSIRSSSLELPPVKAQQVDGEKLQKVDDDFADLEGRISPESLDLIRQIHGISAPGTRASRRETPASSTDTRTRQWSGGPTEFIDVTGKIEIL
ncbi:hypothetical protein Tcan_06620 [Toxocara canis]|uniref:Uncharacterized protein n=1 Tax=Toxocara canis TaxID=6265 RepID=A0A0B2UY48_TOXCA|nr:hypothetical protein Tcan_06620 [Toxocara canis]